MNDIGGRTVVTATIAKHSKEVFLKGFLASVLFVVNTFLSLSREDEAACSIKISNRLRNQSRRAVAKSTHCDLFCVRTSNGAPRPLACLLPFLNL